MDWLIGGCGAAPQANRAVKDSSMDLRPTPESVVSDCGEQVATTSKALPTLLGRTQPPRHRTRLDLPTKSSSAPCNSTTIEALPTKSSSAPLSEAVTKTRSARSAAAALKPEVRCPVKTCKDQFISEYEEICKCGKGSFSTVYLVKHMISKQPRACKVLNKPVKDDDVGENEAEVLKSLNHPHIPKLYEVYVVNRRVHLIVDFCDGGDLATRIQWHEANVPMSENLIAYMMRQILSGTAYCHKKDVIHRDLKPGNILFVDHTAESPIKLTDFGLADFHERLKATAEKVQVERTGWKAWIASMQFGGRPLISPTKSKICMSCAGTPNYMAPEVIKASKKGGYYDHKADMYSIGVILYYLLESCFPFDVQWARRSPPNRLEVPAAASNGVCAGAEQPRFTRSSWTASWLCKDLLKRSGKRRPSAEEAMAYSWLQDPAKKTPYGHGQNGTNSGALTNSTFEELRKYPAYNKLKRAALQLLEQELTEREIQELRARFMALDKKGDGLLSLGELKEGMRHIGYAMDDNELERIVEAMDTSGTQRIGYREFVSALIHQSNFDEEHLRECFKKFDARDSGRISYDDASRVLMDKGEGTCSMTVSEWGEIVHRDGLEDASPQRFEFTFDQFVALMLQDS